MSLSSSSYYVEPNVTYSSDLGLPIQYSCDVLIAANDDSPPTEIVLDYYYDMIYPYNIQTSVAAKFVESGLLQSIARRYKLKAYDNDDNACMLSSLSSSSSPNEMSRNNGNIAVVTIGNVTEQLRINNGDYWMVNASSQPNDVLNTLFDQSASCVELGVPVNSGLDLDCKTMKGSLSIGLYGIPNTDEQIKQFVFNHFNESIAGTSIDVKLLGFQINPELYVNKDELSSDATDGSSGYAGGIAGIISSRGGFPVLDEHNSITPEGIVFSVGLISVFLLFVFIIYKRFNRHRQIRRHKKTHGIKDDIFNDDDNDDSVFGPNSKFRGDKYAIEIDDNNDTSNGRQIEPSIVDDSVVGHEQHKPYALKQKISSITKSQALNSTGTSSVFNGIFSNGRNQRSTTDNDNNDLPSFSSSDKGRLFNIGMFDFSNSEKETRKSNNDNTNERRNNKNNRKTNNTKFGTEEDSLAQEQGTLGSIELRLEPIED